MAVVQVTRAGDLSSPAEVEYATQSGTALDRTDFTAAYGTLRFAAGESSIEFQETGYLVYRLHQAAFGTGEQLQLSRFLNDTQEIRQGIIVGEGTWEQQLEANKQLFAERFVGRAEFLARYPLTMSPQQFVDALNANTGGSLSQAERDAVVSQLAAAGNTTQARAQALRSIADDADFRTREMTRAFVLMQYFGYLRRNPPDAPDIGQNYDGYNFWLSKLNQFGGNFVSAEMVKAFITSDEYTHRFGQ